MSRRINRSNFVQEVGHDESPFEKAKLECSPKQDRDGVQIRQVIYQSPLGGLMKKNYFMNPSQQSPNMDRPL